MMNRVATILVVVATVGVTGLGVTGAAAEFRDLTAVQEQRSHLGQASDSLMSVRIRLVARRDSLSAVADSLWRVDAQSTQLLRTRSASRILVARLHAIERHLDSLEVARDSLDADLRDAYDWELARLLGSLTEDGWDEGLYRQLLVFREERADLGNTIRASAHRFDEDDELSVAADDGPEELRQKIEFAQDRVAAYQQEQHEIARQLRFIERDVMMIRRYWHLADEMLRRRGSESDMLQMRVVPGPEGSSVELAPPDAESPATRGAMGLSQALPDSSAPMEAPWLLEGQRLKARAQELNEVEAVLQERISVFHEHLARILAGDE